MDERKPGTRLITQNLLTSAALFEQRETINWQSVQDLAAFIDLFCLYDNVVVLGRNVLGRLHNWNSELLDMMDEEKFLIVEHPYQFAEKVTAVAGRHLASFLGEQEIDRFEEFLHESLNPQKIEYALEAMPHGDYEIRKGREWLLTTPSHLDLIKQLEEEKSFTRSATFLVRTFLYLAYANVSKSSFTPDAARCPVLDFILTKQEQFRGRLLDALNKPWTDGVGDKELLNRVSPFAALVFKRAGKQKHRIVSEITKLRQELQDDRKRLRHLEDKALWGSYTDRLKATEKYNQVINELTASFGVTHPLKVTTKFILDMSGEVGELADAPRDWTSWAKIIKLPDHIIKRIVARKTTVGIHRLIQDPNLPASENLRSTVYHLFGSIKD